MKKLLLTFLIAFITALGANAKTATLTLDGYSVSGTEISSLSLANGDISLNVTGGNGLKYYTANKKEEAAFRLYANASMKFTCNNTNEKITKIEFTMSTSNGTWSNPISTPTGFNSKTSIWESTDGAQEVTIKNGGTSQARFTKVVITYGGGSGEEKPVLGEIKMDGNTVSTVEATPTTAKVKGGGAILFTSENAASMNVYTLSDNALAASSGEGSVTWTAPVATDEEQVIDLKVVSQLQNVGEELQKKEAFVTVTVPVKSNVSDDFTLITDAGDLYDGMEMYIVSHIVSGTLALSTTQNNNNRGQTDVTIENGILTPTPLAQLITLEATNETDKPWKFNVGDGYYLYAASSSSNYLKTSASRSDNKEKATISIATNGDATITFQGTKAHNVLKYNSNDKLFSCYTSGQTPVQIYAKKTTVNKGLVDGTISYKTKTFTYTIGSEATLPELVKEPADVDVEYSISHERVENGVAVYNPATIDEQGNITVNTPGIVTVTATVKANPTETSSYVLEIQSLKEAEIAGTGSATPTGNEYNKINDKYDMVGKTLYAILSCCNGKVYAMTPKPNVNEAGNEANDGFLATVVNNNATKLADKYTIDNPDMALFLYDANLDCFTYNDNGTTKYLVEESRHLKFVEEQPSEKKLEYYGYAENNFDALKIDELPLYCNPTQGYFNTFESSNSQFGTYLFNCFLYKVGAQITSASTVKAPVVHITGGNVYYSPDGEWYWGTEDENNKLSFANETDGAKIYYIKSSATPSSANVRAMANSATVTEYSTPFKKSDLDGMKITFWAEKDGQKSAVETLNFNIKTGIEDIDVENAEAIEEEGDARYFNLQGLEVKNPGEGIYIRVANGKATKILKK